MVKKTHLSPSAENPCTPAINSLATAPAPAKILRVPVEPSPAKKKVNWDHHPMCVGGKKLNKMETTKQVQDVLSTEIEISPKKMKV